MLVSVVIPARDVETYIETTLESVLRQTWDDLEVLVVDDGSQDQTAEIVLDISKRDHRLKLIQNPGPVGPAGARNAGLDAATGAYIAFLDSDDLWERRKVELQVRGMQDLRMQFSYTLYDVIDEFGNPVTPAKGLPARATRNSLRPHCYVRTSTVIILREALGHVRFPDLPKRQDFGYFLLCLAQVPAGGLVPEVLTSYRIRPGSVSSNKFRNVRFQWQVYRDVEHLHLPTAGWLMARWASTGALIYLNRLWGILSQRYSRSK